MFVHFKMLRLQQYTNINYNNPYKSLFFFNFVNLKTMFNINPHP